jgi:hypothetical protein
MLIALGTRALRTALRPATETAPGPRHEHAHGPSRERRFAGRSLAYGIIHGLAGSGSLTALVIANLPSLSSRVAYIALFGTGSMIGMATLSGLAGLSLSRMTAASRTLRVVGALTGLFSIALGLRFAAPIVMHAWR